MTSSMPSSLPRHTAHPTTKLQRLQRLLPLPNLLQATATSQATRKLRPLQVVLLLQALSSRELHHLQLHRMRPSRRVLSSVSLAAAEATSPLSAPTNVP